MTTWYRSRWAARQQWEAVEPSWEEWASWSPGQRSQFAADVLNLRRPRPTWMREQTNWAQVAEHYRADANRYRRDRWATGLLLTTGLLLALALCAANFGPAFL